MKKPGLPGAEEQVCTVSASLVVLRLLFPALPSIVGLSPDPSISLQRTQSHPVYLFCSSPAFHLRWNPEPEPFLRSLNENLNRALISVNSFLSQGKKKKKPIVSYNKSAHYLYYSDYHSRHCNWLLRGFRRNCVFKGLCLDTALLGAELGFCGQIRRRGPGISRG